MTETGVFEAGDTSLDSGETLLAARIAFRTHGTLNAARDNAVVFPTCYLGRHDDNGYLIGPGRALDPERLFIIVPDMLGNGLSSSPSNTTGPQGGAGFPHVTIADNVRLQHRLVAEHFGIPRLRLVLGHSMGALQAYHWAVHHPDMVERLAPICGAARVSRHNAVFLDGLRAALTADAAFAGGRYEAQPLTGIRAMARVYAGWAWSQAFYRERLDLTLLGAASLEDFLDRIWEPAFTAWDANDLLAMLWTWRHADVSDHEAFGGDLARALSAVRARAIVLPCRTDLYFPPEDSALEVAAMRHAELRPIPSIWGHMAGGGLNPVDTDFIDAALKELLAS